MRDEFQRQYFKRLVKNSVFDCSLITLSLTHPFEYKDYNKRPHCRQTKNHACGPTVHPGDSTITHNVRTVQQYNNIL
jgi:hypothetical protein